MPFRKSDIESFLKNIKGGGVLGVQPPKSHSSFADDKASGDLIPQMQA